MSIRGLLGVVLSAPFVVLALLFRALFALFKTIGDFFVHKVGGVPSVGQLRAAQLQSVGPHRGRWKGRR